MRDLGPRATHVLERGPWDSSALKTATTIRLGTASFARARAGQRTGPCPRHSRRKAAWPRAEEISGRHPKMSPKQLQSLRSALWCFENVPNGGLCSRLVRSPLSFPSCLQALKQQQQQQQEHFLFSPPRFHFSYLLCRRLLASSTCVGVKAASAFSCAPDPLRVLSLVVSRTLGRCR